MADRINRPQVGAPDPELNTSPILEEYPLEAQDFKLQQPGAKSCLFNNRRYDHGSYICSGDNLLHCDYGVWIKAGSCDPDNI
ncbi:DUF1496 domain-containing protein [Methylobacter sp. YRD-M1]|uniref:DUF1496 domain-containing protein n=1 Tax=Methylobacter sp. YRD-M1 TaxID=2911520 RepID=UPI00227CF96D|nr:DUF1496 domain-containing protein [Methylobacter sp. YRD-M1]WAK00842.1 DUF1496 domain-containing protein [Methylobacter sp. YRD-M1]